MFLEYSSTDEAQSQWFSALSGGDPSGLWIEHVVSLDSGIRRNDGRAFLNRYFIREDG
ncbi:MAG TPA: hypothetical protein VHK01_17910 [Lacipirellulaceae bacterium]|nr:hypothetical protein [Lacipirellulaceae bacterium]